MNSTFSVVGRRTPYRNEAVEKVTGTAEFTVDIVLPGMLYARVLRSPHAHAKIAEIETDGAEKLKGVKAVVTFRDSPKVLYNTGDRYPPVPRVFPQDKYVLDETVRHVGDTVAAVAAESEDIAEEALKEIRVKYELLPAVFDPEDAMKLGAPLIHSVERNLLAHPKLELGDIERGFKEADLVFEDKYVLPIVHHCSLEPHATVAAFAKTGRLTVWTSTQIPFAIRGQLARVLGMPVEMVRVVKPYVGSAFGGKQEMMTEPICALLARKARRPVKLEYDREEMFYASTTRHSCKIELKTGLKKNGLFTARQMKAIANTGAYASHGPPVTGAMGWFFSCLYRSPNIRFDGYCVYTNAPPAGAFRGYGNPQATFAVECQVDKITEELGLDPVEFHLLNTHKVGDVEPFTGYKLETCGIQDCIAAAAKKAKWTGQRGRQAAHGTKRRGIGMACMVHCTGAKPDLPEYSAAVVKFNENGTVSLLTGLADMGQGSNATLAHIVAEELGIRLDDVMVAPLDTDVVPLDKGVHASRGTAIGGHAALMAAREAKKKLLAKASEILKTPPSELDVKDRQVFVKSFPDSRIEIGKVVTWSLIEKSPHEAIMGEATYEPETNALTWGAHFAEVEVDVLTGETKVIRIVAAHDAGRIINRLGAEGQVEGALLQGIGYALKEKLLLDETTGRLLNADFIGYNLPSSLDLPEEIEIVFVETIDPIGPFGAKGLAEMGMVSIAPAIANAIYDAVGTRFHELPMTRQKILEALRQKPT
jgi:xanthine dehydrogenase molybdenum-binding subunit